MKMWRYWWICCRKAVVGIERQRHNCTMVRCQRVCIKEQMAFNLFWAVIVYITVVLQ